jgi:hypothetical protein
MKNKFIIILLSVILYSTGHAQDLNNPQKIGQLSRNQAVGKGLQIPDTTCAQGVLTSFNLVSLRFLGSDGITYQLTIGDSLPGLPYTIPHCGIYGGDPNGDHTMFELENNATFGTHPPHYWVAGRISNNMTNSVHYTISGDTVVDIHTEDSLDTYNLHYRWSSGGFWVYSGGTNTNAAGYALDVNGAALNFTGGITPAKLDSVQLISVAAANPPVGTMYFCTDCHSNSGNGLIAIYVSGSLWRKL